MQAEGDVVTQARKANIDPIGFGASNPAHLGGEHMRTARGRTNDWLKRPGEAVHGIVNSAVVARSWPVRPG